MVGIYRTRLIYSSVRWSRQFGSLLAELATPLLFCWCRWSASVVALTLLKVFSHLQARHGTAQCVRRRIWCERRALRVAPYGAVPCRSRCERIFTFAMRCMRCVSAVVEWPTTCPATFFVTEHFSGSCSVIGLSVCVCVCVCLSGYQKLIISSLSIHLGGWTHSGMSVCSSGSGVSSRLFAHLTDLVQLLITFKHCLGMLTKSIPIPRIQCLTKCQNFKPNSGYSAKSCMTISETMISGKNKRGIRQTCWLSCVRGSCENFIKGKIFRFSEVGLKMRFRQFPALWLFSQWRPPFSRICIGLYGHA